MKDYRIEEFLWADAYDLLSEDLKAILDQHEDQIAGLEKALIEPKLREKVFEEWIMTLARKSLRIRELGQGILESINVSRRYLRRDSRTNRRTNIACTCVPLLLSLIIEQSDQTEMMLSGLDFISSLIGYHCLWSDIWVLPGSLAEHQRSAAKDLYLSIFSYQAQLLYHLYDSSSTIDINALERCRRHLVEAANCSDRFQSLTNLNDTQKHRKKWNKDYATISERSSVSDSMSRHLSRVRQERLGTPSDLERKAYSDILLSLSGSLSNGKDLVPDRFPGTSEWVIKDKRFKSWLDSKEDSLLCLFAAPGCGKSVVAKYLINSNILGTSGDTSVLYFFFNNRDVTLQNSEDVLATLLHQFYTQNAQQDTLISTVQNFASYGPGAVKKFEDLWDIFTSAIAEPTTGELFCVLDALDECSENERRRLVTKMMKYFAESETRQRKGGRLKVMITSRPYSSITRALDSTSANRWFTLLTITEESLGIIKNDIDMFVDARIRSGLRNETYETQQQIAEEVKIRANYTFLWVHLNLDYIIRQFSSESQKLDVDELLNSLPTEICTTYELMLQDSTDPPQSKSLLQLVIAARRPLTIKEANYALEMLRTSENSFRVIEESIDNDETFSSRLRDICGLMLVASNSHVYFIDKSARTFLLHISKLIETSDSRTYRDFDYSVVNREMFKACISFLCLDNYKLLYSQKVDKINFNDRGAYSGELLDGLGLFKYAAEHWVEHAQLSDCTEELMLSKQLRLCDLADSTSAWYSVYCRQKGLRADYSMNSLVMASHLGLYQVAERLLQRGYESSEQSQYYGCALQAASLNGHVKIVKMLLDHGTDVNTLGGHHGTPLQAASAGGYIDIVETLLDHGANIDLPGGHYGSALQAASARGHSEVIDMLSRHRRKSYLQNTRSMLLFRNTQSPGYNTVASDYFQEETHTNSHGRKRLNRHFSELSPVVSEFDTLSFHSDKPSLLERYPGFHSDTSDAIDAVPAFEHDNSIKISSSLPPSKDIRSADTTSEAFTKDETAESLLSEVDILREVVIKTLTETVLMKSELKYLYERLLSTIDTSEFKEVIADEIQHFCSDLRNTELTKLQTDIIEILLSSRESLANTIYNQAHRQKRRTDKRGMLKRGWKEVPATTSKLPKLVSTSTMYRYNAQSPLGIGASTSLDKFTNMKPYEYGQKAKVSPNAPELYESAYFTTYKTTRRTQIATSRSGESKFKAVSNQPPTTEAINRLADGVPFRNFAHNIARYILSPFDYISRVLGTDRSSSEEVTTAFHVEWQLRAARKKELDDDATIGRTLTLSGGAESAEASSCLEYSRRNWPRTGVEVVAYIEEAISLDNYEKWILPDVRISSRRQPSTYETACDVEEVVFTVKGKANAVTEIIQQLAWMTTVFRVSKENCLTVSQFYFHETEKPDSFRLSLKELREVRTASLKTCWHPLFLNGVLADGFPIQRRSTEVGVELPFEVMTYLAGVTSITNYKGKHVLDGFHAIIVPQSISPPTTGLDKGSVQWHLIYHPEKTPVLLSVLDKEDERADFSPTDIGALAEYRSFLGCYKEVSIHLGTREVDYTQVHRSDLSTENPGFQISSFSLSSALPKLGGPSASLYFTRPKKTLSLIRDELSYEDILRYSSDMPVILYDTLSFQGWMVPALSAILHMIHIRAALPERHCGFPKFEKPPFAEPIWDIGQEALKIAYHNRDFQLYLSSSGEQHRLKDRVIQYWKDLQNAVQIELGRESRAKTLIGWDLLGFVRRDPMSDPMQQRFHAFKGNWKKLANDPRLLVLFGAGLGDIITPKTENQALCEKWMKVPNGYDYLTASVKCLQSNTFQQLGFTPLNKSPQMCSVFSSCSHHSGLRCHRAQRLVPRDKLSDTSFMEEERGAVIFGDTPITLQKDYKNLLSNGTTTNVWG